MIAHCGIQAIEGSTCYKCGNEGHFIKDCSLHQNNPIQHHNLTPNHKHSYTPYSRSNSSNTDMLTPITQTLNNLWSNGNSYPQQTQAHTVPPLTTKAITTIQIDIDINILTGIQKAIVMVITTETNHTMKI